MKDLVLYSFENYYILIFCALFLLIMHILGYVKKKAAYSMITLIVFMTSLIVHIIKRELLADFFKLNVYIDLLFVGISITNLLIIDEIETRREFIKVVFENRYKNKK